MYNLVSVTLSYVRFALIRSSLNIETLWLNSSNRGYHQAGGMLSQQDATVMAGL